MHSANVLTGEKDKTAEYITPAVPPHICFFLSLDAIIVLPTFSYSCLSHFKPFISGNVVQTIYGYGVNIRSYSRRPHFSGWVPQARNYSPCPRIGVASETGKFKSLPNINRLPSFYLPRRRGRSSGHREL